MMTASVYDNTGADYNVTNVLSAEGTLDPVAYAAYSPPFLSATFAFVYGLSFASITSVIVHVYLWHGKDIYDALRGRQPLDIHARLMRSYKKVPLWWYGTILVVFTALSIVLVGRIFGRHLGRLLTDFSRRRSTRLSCPCTACFWHS